MNYFKFISADPAESGHGYCATAEDPPTGFIVTLDAFIAVFQPEGYPRPYLSATRVMPGSPSWRERVPTWTVDFLIPATQQGIVTGFVEWHDDHAVAVDGYDGRLIWQSDRVLP